MVSLGRRFGLTFLAGVLASWSVPASAQKATDYQAQTQYKSEAGGGFYLQKPRERLKGLTGRATYGEGGAVRIILLSWPPPGERDNLEIKVRFVNEGQEAFILEPTDVWYARTEKDAKIDAVRRVDPASADQGIVVDPHGSIEVTLLLAASPRHKIIALDYKSQYLGHVVEVRAPYLAPAPRFVLPPIYPPLALGETGERTVRVSALVGTDGRVNQVFVLEPSAEKDPFGLRPAAEQAIREWVFDPALQDREAQRGVYEATFTFGDQVLARTTLPLAPVELALRLSRMLQDTYTSVISLPRASGFVVVEPARPDVEATRTRAYMIRFGEQPPGRASWLAVGEAGLRSRMTTASCTCTEWDYDRTAAERFLRTVMQGLGVEAAAPTSFAVQGDVLVPGGLPEPETAGRWRKDTMRRVLKAALLGGGEEPQTTGDRRTAAVRLPAEDEFIKPVEAMTGEVRPPEKITGVSPTYPESARMGRVEGKVVLESVIDAQGDVTDIRVVRSIPQLDQAAIDAVCCWKYKPAMLGGKAVPVYFTTVVEFKLRGQ